MGLVGALDHALSFWSHRRSGAGVNEPHYYLGKAETLLEPSMVRRRHLLYNSSNAHWVFYFVTGYWRIGSRCRSWLGPGAPSATGCSPSAGCERCTSSASFVGRLGGRSWGSSRSQLGKFFGEWLVGGIEGKVFSYGFLFLAFADWQSYRPYRAALWVDWRSVFIHRGGWGVLAGLLAGRWKDCELASDRWG